MALSARTTLRNVDVWKSQLLQLLWRINVPFSTKSNFTKPKRKRKFIDSLRVYVRGGAGGQGLPRYGGIGGDGGSVSVIARKDITLIDVAKRNEKKRYIAGTGANSRKFCLLGEQGKNLEIPVPVGVVVKSDNNEILADLDEPNQKAVIAHGGKGGHPGNNFLGLKGEIRNVMLDLKLIADIGLVGFPNAGKSTFLGSVSRAKPKIADYPFTTIQPQIGVMEYPDFRRISVADLPGLIEGAHVNCGMGHQFLKHVERTKLLLFVVDINGFKLGINYTHRTAFETILLLNQELELYREDLLSKPAILALNKCDVEGSEEKLEEVVRLINNLPESLETVDADLRPSKLVQFDGTFVMSAKYGTSVDGLKVRMRELLDIYADMNDTKDRSEKSIVHSEHKLEIPGHLQEQAKTRLV
ncbi:GTP-binding protein 10-like [Gigantopelta aegis]|uniref:GTP-binding protein 10-like n=1 Tax=Gigantopelta aegis TaxID=1735272 RepID=UPI001B88BE76|nr:GTP-binding protein 10-like [Gigantopelta aegis]XP_041366324.1 GTP-binding protein 10-like [Gigantopelta aegis]